MPNQTNTRMSAIGHLDILPLFCSLKTQRVLVAGCADGVLWKLQLLAATGAEIIYLAVNPDKAITDWLGTTKNVQWRQADWQERDFHDVRLAIGSFDTDQEAERFALNARQAKVWVNLIDRPSLCDFQFGSIVNRGPVTIGISTHGAAPVLGQAIRQRLETLLPAKLGDWAQQAKHARAKIAKAFPKTQQRRRFWESFAQMALSRPDMQPEQILDSPSDSSEPSGKVFLVGAGPGDTDSLTLRAMQVLQTADIILSDDLIRDEVLQLARREARRIWVGKRAGQASCRQDDINTTMRDLARQGLRVVRLKSGDPSIFARAAQEITFLREAGIAVEMVPGISLAMAAAARLGVSLTNRDCARGLKFITAHSRHDDLPDLDWRACADLETTLMIYMGGRTAQKLARTLIAQGLPESVPVMVSSDIAGDNEAFMPMRLADLSQAKLPLQHPILIGIGQVFAPCLVSNTNSPEI